MRVIERIRHYVSAMGQAKRHRSDLGRWLVRRPQVLVGTGVYETMLLLSNSLDPRLKELAELKTAGLVNCEFCLDIGSALAHSSGLTERQLLDLPRYRTSDAYDDLEKDVLAFAEAMTRTPAVDLDEVRERLSKRLSKTQLAELAAAVAWENQRARLNQGLGVRPTGMSEGMVCALPELGGGESSQ
ncbi:carboxymuconolactone decarboxylase family protein [Nocardia bovistercoris]|uniref:Carboxymuconolactone decarboxylase family protein n=1 Tax=Nocardia bovistercoris TaxID=2785916 RepID=A0A931N5H2_9NOCA|nr:carboxymuconolactone decarboxylase family protein [Nocardia bovistercoris]MBH0779406.1 carboxymuconolactone decarboxylase family protein [Nocardia bovistercoris]